MSEILARKLEHYTRLSGDDRAALRSAIGKPRAFAAREDIIREGDNPEHVNLVLDGWACRYKQLDDGRRQIISFLLPGDLCDSHIFVLREMDHSIGTLTSVNLAEIPRKQIETIAADHPRLDQALWWECLMAAAVQREWTVNLGQRRASERLGHLFCELFLRLRAVGMTDRDGTRYPLPITQSDLADTLGLSVVHLNRSLQELRRSGLIALKHRHLAIPDMEALQAASLFNPRYLHLNHEGRHLDANESDAA